MVSTRQCMLLLLGLLLVSAVTASLQEGSALLSLKHELGDPLKLKSWTEASDPCQQNWFGVVCTGNFVTQLNLSNLLLRGTFAPETFLDLPNLTKLLLANNSLSGNIPDSMLLLSNLTELDLAYNNFSGNLPSEFEKLPNLQVLSLTGNLFNEIHFNFGNLAYLQYVLLGDCGLTGDFPSGVILLTRLVVLDLEDNQFAGVVPNELWALSTLSVLGLRSSGLTLGSLSLNIIDYLRRLRYVSLPRDIPEFIQRQIPRAQDRLCNYVEWIKCRNKPVPFPSTPPSPSPSIQPSRNPSNKRSTLKAIVGGVIGGTSFLVALIWVLLYYWQTRWRIQKHKHKDAAVVEEGKEDPSIELKSMANPVHAFTFRELEVATEYFNTEYILGTGSFGEVFRGVLGNGKTVAIKKMNGYNWQGDQEFRIEVDLLSSLRHSNLVRLLGYCADKQQRLLVYEFMSNGSLDRYLEGGSAVFTLDFQRRLKIALGAAKGLAYLHAGGGYSQPVVHRDFKASNILLDEYFGAKVADFGYAKLLNDIHATTRVIGTFGYLDPQYTATGQLTPKADVFSFGVVLVQLLTGKPAIVLSKDGTPQTVVTWCRHCLGVKRKLKKILDKQLGSAFSSKCAQRLAALAAWCVRDKGEERPSMPQCVKIIEEILVDSALQLEKVSSFN